MLIPSYAPMVGGAEIQLGGLLRHMDRDRFEPFVVTRHLPGTATSDFERDTRIIRLPSPLVPGAFLMSALRYLWRRRREYDVIHVHSLDSPALAGSLIKQLLPGKIYIQRIPRFGQGSSFDLQSRTRFGRARLRWVLGKADAVIPLCPDATAALEEMAIPESRIVRIPNGVDTDYFVPSRRDEKGVLKRSFGIPESAFVGLVVARLITRKHVAAAVEAWKCVVAGYPDSVLIVAGGGPEGPRLEAFAKENFGDHTVIFTGETSREEVARLMRTSDVFVSYSEPEGMSNAMLEAMSSGLPIVASRGPGIDQMVAHTKNGFLFDPRRPGDGAEYLVRLAEDPALVDRMATAARVAAESRYSFEHVAREFEKLYRGERVGKTERTPRRDAGREQGGAMRTERSKKSRRSKKRRRKKRNKVGSR